MDLVFHSITSFRGTASQRHPRMALINSAAEVERQAALGVLKMAACCCLRLSGQTAAMSDCCSLTAEQNYGRE